MKPHTSIITETRTFSTYQSNMRLVSRTVFFIFWSTKLPPDDTSLIEMAIYLTKIDQISAVKKEMKIDDGALPSLNQDALETLEEFTKILAEVRRVSCQLEA